MSSSSSNSNSNSNSVNIMSPEDRFQYAVEFVLKHEGGYSNLKEDPGGSTDYGISLRFIKEMSIDVNNDKHVNVVDILALDKTKAIKIYRSYWWDKYQYNEIRSIIVATKIFDLAVNMGPKQAHKLVQRAINSITIPSKTKLVVDGILGPKTLSAINSNNSLQLVNAIKTQAINFYTKLARQHPNFKLFLKGWLRRAND